MSIFSNRWVQGALAIGVIVIGFFAYQSNTSDISEDQAATDESAEAATTNTTNDANTTVDVINSDGTKTNAENTVNSTDNSDTINTAAEETTNQ